MKLRLAILDLNAGLPNQGMRCISEIVSNYHHLLEVDVFDVRVTAEVPDLSYDIYISSGGPGNPMEGDGVWDERFYTLVQDVWEYNKYEGHPKKYFFFICHSLRSLCTKVQFQRLRVSSLLKRLFMPGFSSLIPAHCHRKP